MTSRFNGKKQLMLGLSSSALLLSALLFLSVPVQSQSGGEPDGNRIGTPETGGGNTAGDGMSAMRARRLREFKERMRNGFGGPGGFGQGGPGDGSFGGPGGNGQPGFRGQGDSPGNSDPDMPGFKMRKRLGQEQGQMRAGADGPGGPGGPGGFGGPAGNEGNFDGPGRFREMMKQRGRGGFGQGGPGGFGQGGPGGFAQGGPGGPGGFGQGGPGGFGQGGPGGFGHGAPGGFAQGGPGGPGGFGQGGPGGSGGGFSGRQGRFGRMQQGGGGFGGQLDLTPLGLNEDQKTKIKAMREQTRAKIKDLRKGLSEKQTEMRSLMFNPDANEAQIRAAAAQMRKMQTQMDETNMNDLLSIRGMLTPEQRKKLPECMPGRNKMARGGGGPGFDGPDGPPGPGGPPPEFDGPPPGEFNEKSSSGNRSNATARRNKRSFQAGKGAAK